MWKLHRLPESIILDRGPQFTAGLIRELNEILEIKSKLLTVLKGAKEMFTVTSKEERQ